MSNRLHIKPEGHSPLGGSSMARAIACPGSVALSYGLDDEEIDDTFSLPGTAAHKVAETCLARGCDSWELVGYVFRDHALTRSKHLLSGDVLVNEEMANAAQVYLDRIRKQFPDLRPSNHGVEHFVHAPTIHPYFWMATDFYFADWDAKRLHIKDYKHGAGIVVEVERNVQQMFYACGVLEDLDAWHLFDEVEIEVVQPRAWHPDGPIRTWTVSVDDLLNWMEFELVPAMDRALVSRDTKAGQHCRFCPAAGRQCPAILAATEEFAEMISRLKLTDENAAKKLTAEQMSRFAALEDMHKIAAKHVGRAIWGALQAGVKVEGRKLVNANVHREWKKGAKAALKRKFGEEAYEERALKTPAQVEALPGGKDFCARWAFKPPAGLTVASDRDVRTGINKDMKSGFKPVARKGKK